MKNRMVHLLLLLSMALVWVPPAAQAAAKITVAITAEKEITVKENGKEVKRVVEANDILPGEVITYTLTYRNSGDEAAQAVAVNNRISPETTYVLGSATETDVDTTFSIDNAKSFKKPSMLTYEITRADGTKEKQLATPELYTHIRWVVPNIAANEQGSVSFKTRVK